MPTETLVRTGAKGLIIEGIHGAGKTRTIPLILQQLLASEVRSFQMMTEALTQRSTGHSSAAERYSNLLNAIRTVQFQFWSGPLAGHSRTSEFAPYFLCETFHLTALVQKWLSPAQATELDCALFDLGARTVLLTIPEEEILSRSITTTRAFRRPGWASYLTQFGHDEAAQARYLTQLQRELRAGIRSGKLRFCEISTTDSDWTAAAQEAVAFFNEE